ncbi:MAG: glycosyltransferase [Gemmataceae bacterium]
MHVMFIHPNFPAQFGLLAHLLSTQLGWTCTFVTSVDTTQLQLSFNHINYRLKDDEPQPKVFHNPESLEGLFEHMTAIYRGLRGVPQIQPDLVVGHMSYGTMLYLRNLYHCPFVGYYELLPPAFWGSGMVLRKEFEPPEGVRLFNASYHTFTHLHLQACDAAYTPTAYQTTTCPIEWRHKLRVLHDGIDCQLFQPRGKPDSFKGQAIDKNTKYVTYVSRSLESVRGFDIFMKMASKICERRSDVRFLIVGAPRTNYGHELFHIGKKTFKEWVLEQGNYPADRFVFLDLIPPQEIANLFNISDVHVSLTVPYPGQTSILQAMASGCPVVASDTEPVREVVTHGKTGLLADFYDVDGLAEQVLTLLNDRSRASTLGTAARKHIEEHYELQKCFGKQVHFFQEFSNPMAARDTAFASLG